jgi:hypothetical protein
MGGEGRAEGGDREGNDPLGVVGVKNKRKEESRSCNEI